MNNKGKIEELGFDLKVYRDEHGNNLLMYAIMWEKEELVKDILQYYKTIIDTALDGKNGIIGEESSQSFVKQIKYMFSLRNNEGSNCLHLACYTGNVNIIRELVSLLYYIGSKCEETEKIVGSMYFIKNDSEKIPMDYLLVHLEELKKINKKHENE